METEFGNEKVQQMIDILGTHGDYEKELAQVVEGDKDGPRSNQPSPWYKSWNPFGSKSKSNKPSKTMFNGYKLPQKDDTTFLTEICTIVVEEPAYCQIVEEILREATTSVRSKLKRLEKELLRLVGKELPRITRQEIDERINAERQNADLVASTRLRALIRQTLDAEEDHPTNR
jgi:hypothetical protein